MLDWDKLDSEWNSSQGNTTKGNKSTKALPKKTTDESTKKESGSKATSKTSQPDLGKFYTRDYLLGTPSLARAYANTLSDEEKQKITDEYAKKFANAPATYGFLEALSPLQVKSQLEQNLGAKIDTSKVEDSTRYKVGSALGTMAQFAIPYGGASSTIGKAVVKLPKVAKMGKLGQNIVKSVATDLAVGLPLNANYAINKENNKTVVDVVKSVGVNTALDLITGGILETVPVVLKSGKKVVSKAIFNGLNKAEKAEVVKSVSDAVEKNGIIKDEINPSTTQQATQPTSGVVGNTGFNTKERGFSENISTDRNMEQPIRQSFTDRPEMYSQLANADTLKRANTLLNNDGIDLSYNNIVKAVAENSLKPEHIPLAKLVANQIAKDGNVDRARQLLSDVAVRLTEAGQLSQSAIILRNSDPLSVLQFIEKTLSKTNAEMRKRLGKKFVDLKLNDDEIKMLTNINIGDENAIANSISIIGKRLAKEVKATNFEKFDELRRVAMLGNFKTQIRNFVGNAPIMLERKIANKTSALIQSATIPRAQRTQSLFVTKESKDIANELFKQDKIALLHTNKWDTNDIRKILNEEKQVFNQSVVGKVANKLNATDTVQGIADKVGLEGYRKLVYLLLEKGDIPFLKSAYVDRLASYISAKGYKSIDEIPQEAVDVAREEALKATYRDANEFAEMVNKMKRKGGMLGKSVEAVVPFATTPANLVRRTIDYSPIGVVRELAKIKNAEDVPLAIDRLSQGLTGTALLGLGILMANHGVLVGKLQDNKYASEYEKSTGRLPYSISTPFGSVTYSWAQPIGSQLAMASEIYKTFHNTIQDGGKVTSKLVANALANAGYASVDSILDTSVYGNIANMLSGYGSQGQRIVQQIEQYPQQAIPVIGGQIGRTLDKYVRNPYDYTSDSSTYKNVALNKLPYASKQLPIKYDSWGRPVTRVENTALRALQELFNPANVSTGKKTPIDDEIMSLYQRTGSESVFPKYAPTSFKLNGETFNLDNKDTSYFQKQMGKYAYEMAYGAIKNGGWNNMSDEERLQNLQAIYSTAWNMAKVDLAQSRGK